MSSKILVKCIQDVVHGRYTLIRGQEAMMHPHEAMDLKAFVEPIPMDAEERVKSLGNAPQNKMMPDMRNKGDDEQAEDEGGGEGNDSPPGESPESAPTQSSASPADQASHEPTATASKPGARKGRGGR